MKNRSIEKIQNASEKTLNASAENKKETKWSKNRSIKRRAQRIWLKNKMKSSTSKKVKFPSLRRNQKSESTKKARNIFNIFHNDHY